MQFRLHALALSLLIPMACVGPLRAQGVTAPTTSPFGRPPEAAATAGTVLTAPATLNANTATGVDALQVTNSGSGRAIIGLINKAGSSVSAIRGETNGSGAGINGANSGTAGPAGKFQISNAGSTQPALISTTNGAGSAIQAISTYTGFTNAAALLGQSTAAPPGAGIGVEGNGSYIGVKALSATGYGLYAKTGDGYAIVASSNMGYGIVATSNSRYGVWGSSSADFSGYFAGHAGVYAEGTANWAGYFAGNAKVTGALYAASFNLNSDRALKQGFAPVQGGELLDRIERLPISRWNYTATPGVRHIGPMAQDFREAFGLGSDDTHIEVVDIAGVSLAAIQELRRQLRQKADEVETLRTRMDAIERGLGLAAQANMVRRP